MKITQKLSLVLFLIFFANKSYAQLGGVFSVPNDFPTIAAAITSLNLLGVAAPVTVNVAAGYTETAVAGGYKLNSITGASSSNQITFMKNGFGANPLITAYVGTAIPTSSVQDGVWWLVGADYITIDGIDIYDPNTTSPATMEFGYGLYKASNNNGCQNNTIKNCVITLNRTNGVAGAGVVPCGARGIDIMSSLATQNTVAVTVTSTLGTNSFNKFYSNTIQNCHIGIAAISYSSSSTYMDRQNDIGGSSSLTGNIILNFGGSGTTEASGVRTLSQRNVNVSYNTFNNNNGSGSDPVTVLKAVNIGSATSVNSTINSNTITMIRNSGANTFYGIYNESGSTASSNTVDINNNVFPAFTVTGTAIGGMVVIVNTGSPAFLNINSNLITNVRTRQNCRVISAVNTISCSISSNTISGVINNTGSLRAIYYENTSYQLVANNFIDDVISYETTSTNQLYCIDGTTGPYSTIITNTINNVRGYNIFGICLEYNATDKTISNNVLSNFTSPPSPSEGTSIVGIKSQYTTPTITVNGNTIFSFSNTYTFASNNSGNLIGIELNSTPSGKIYQNKIYSITSAGSGSVNGLQLSSASIGTFSIYNNLIADLNTSGSNQAAGLNGIACLSSGHTCNILYNSVYLNCNNTSGTNLGSSAIYLPEAGSYTLRNNIFANTSVATGTGVTSAILKASTSFTNINTSSNRNLLYAGVPATNRVLFNATSTTYSSLSTYKSAVTPRDAQSVTENPPFLSSNGGSINFLEPDPLQTTQIESGAIAVSGFTTDYSGNNRNATTPDIGAREGNYTQADIFPPSVTASGFIDGSCNLSGRTMTFAITDVSGVASGTLSPRLYYRKNFGLYTSVQGSLSSGSSTNGIWTFNLVYSANAADVIWYFLALQDQSAFSNYTLIPSSGSNSSDINTVIIPPSPASNYTITGGATTVSINSGTICAGESFTLQPTGANTYTFSSGSAIVNPQITTTYSVSGTNMAGCITSPVIATVFVNPSPTISANSGFVCTGNVYTIIPTGAATYSYSSGSATVNPTINTNYSVTGTSSLGCAASNTAVVSISIAPNPIVGVNSGTICSGENFTIIPNGASTFTFSSGSAIVNPTVNTTFSVTGTSSLGCISLNTAVASVSVIASPTIFVNSGTICSGESFTILASGANSYTFGGGTSVVNPTVTTSFSVIGTASSGCISNTAFSQVSVNITPTISVNSGSVCAGNVFTINPLGVASFTISGNSTTVSPLSNTLYLVNGTGSNGCLAANTATSNVSVLALPTVSVNSGIICSGKSFTILATGAANYNYPSGSAIVNPTTNTFYPITGTSAQGCVSSNTAIASVTVNTTPTVVVNSGSVCSGQSFTINATGANTYTYSGGLSVVNPLANATYSVIGTATNGCVSQPATSSLMVKPNPTINISNTSICKGQSFTLTPTGASTYTFEGGNAIVSPTITTSYTIAGTSTAGCISQTYTTATLTVNDNPTVSVNSGTICSGTSFTISPNGANSYTIEGGNAIVNPTNNITYTVIGTSSTGCVSQNYATSTVNIKSSPTIAINSGSICSGESFTLIPSGANTYTIQGGNTIVTPTTNATYTISGTNTLGCVSQSFVTSNVTVNPSPTLSVNSGSICSGKSFTIIPSGAHTFTYSGNSSVVTPTSNSSYTITGTSSLGCIASNTVISNVTVHLTPTLSVGDGTICIGQSFTINPTGANTYTFEGGNHIVTPISSTAYSIIGTSTAGCISNTISVSIIVNPLPTISVNSGSVCDGSTFTLIPSGGFTYTYSSGSSVVSPTSNTSYSVSGTSSDGCIGSNIAIANITVNPLPNVNANITKVVICQGDTTTLYASGADTYTWSNGVSNGIVFIPSSTQMFTVNGTNTLTGCTSTNLASIGVTVNPLPILSLSSSHSVLCVGESASLTVTGADIYSWNNDSTTNVIVVSPLVETNYTVEGTDKNNCSTTSTFTQLVSECTAIQNFNLNDNAIKVFPNPSTGKINIQFEYDGKKVITLYNKTGQIIESRVTENLTEELDLTLIAKGIYYINVSSAHRISHFKVLVQ